MRPQPYLTEDRTILYAPEDNEYMAIAKKHRAIIADKYTNSIHTSYAVLVKDGKIIGGGANNPVHKSFCPRTVFDSPTGQEYELCKRYCHSDNHAEPSAIREALSRGLDPNGADIYIYGHWWLCKPCWDKIIEAGIRNVYLVEDAEDKFYQTVSSKGEPQKPLKIFVEGDQPANSLKERFKKVLITFTSNQKEADFVFKFKPSVDLNEREFTIALHEALDDANIYGL